MGLPVALSSNILRPSLTIDQLLISRLSKTLRNQTTISIVIVTLVARKKCFIATVIPTAAVARIEAAVVSPSTRPSFSLWSIVPAPRKLIPTTIAWMIRTGSVAMMSGLSTWFGINSPSATIRAADMTTRICVRRPAGLSASSRS